MKQAFVPGTLKIPMNNNLIMNEDNCGESSKIFLYSDIFI